MDSISICIIAIHNYIEGEIIIYRALIQYKDVVLPVYEISLWR